MDFLAQHAHEATVAAPRVRVGEHLLLDDRVVRQGGHRGGTRSCGRGGGSGGNSQVVALAARLRHAAAAFVDLAARGEHEAAVLPAAGGRGGGHDDRWDRW